MPTHVDDDPMMDVEQVATYLHTTSRALITQRSRGQGPPFVKPGAKLLIRRSALLSWIDSLAERDE